MKIHRRTFLRTACSLPFVGVAGCSTKAQTKPLPSIAAAAHWPDADAVFYPDVIANPARQVKLPMRAHEILPLTEHWLVIGRRPDYRALIVAADGTVHTELRAVRGRHFYGHGCLNGQMLLLSENDVDNGRGVIGIYDSGNFERIGEIESGGVGPHDICAGPEATLVVAHGGIVTHPASGYQILNPNSLKPAISWLDVNSGIIVADHQPADPRYSIRHLAPDGGRVFAAMQFQGDYRDCRKSLVTVCAPDLPLQGLEISPEDLASLGGYIGDICLHPSSRLLATSSPATGQLAVWHADELRFLWRCHLPGVCALTATNAGFVALTEQGGIFLIPAMSLPGETDCLRAPDQKLAFDNHCVRNS